MSRYINKRILKNRLFSKNTYCLTQLLKMGSYKQCTHSHPHALIHALPKVTPTHTQPKKDHIYPHLAKKGYIHPHPPTPSRKKGHTQPKIGHTHPYQAKIGYTHQHPPTPSQKRSYPLTPTHTQPKKGLIYPHLAKKGHTQPQVAKKWSHPAKRSSYPPTHN